MNHILSIVAFLLLVVATVATPAAYFTGGSCTRLSGGPDARLINPCLGVVNYRYFLGSGVTESQLINRANSRLNSTSVAALPLDCQSRYVQYVCSTVFLKCEDAVTDLTDTTTYTNSVYLSGAYPLPFQRPCRSVCSSMIATCGSMGSVLLGMTAANTCGATTDYSKGNAVPTGTTAVFYPSSTDDSSKCYVPRIIPGSGSKEYYLDKENGPCKGLVNQFYILPATSLNPMYATIQLPYTVQSILNNRISTVLNKLPPWIQEDCALSLRKYLCYAAFPSIGETTLTNVVAYSNTVAPGSVSQPIINLLNAQGLGPRTLSVPQFPHYKYCTGFNSTCSALIAKATAIKPNCNATAITNDVTFHRFPSKEQTVQKLPITVIYTPPLSSTAVTLRGTLYIPSSPNSNGYYDSAVYQYAPQCPAGFVIPEDPTGEDVKMVSFSACAISCNVPVWTLDEWSYTINVAKRLPVASIILGLICLLFILKKQDWENTYHVAIYCVLGVLASASSSHNVGYNLTAGYDHHMCYNNAQQREQSQGQTPCSGQGIILTYTFLACCSTIWMMAIYWICRTTKLSWVVHTLWYRVHEFFWIFVLPIIPTAFAGANQLFGYSRTLPYCFVQSGSYAPAYSSAGIVGVPVLIVTILTHTTMSAHDLYIGLCRCGKPYNPKIEHMDGTPVDEKHPNFAIRAVVCLSFLIFIPYLAAEGNQFMHWDAYQKSFQDWSACVFSNFDGTEESYYDECGGRPHFRPFVDLARFIVNSIVSSNIVVVPAFLLSYNLSTRYFPFTVPGYKSVSQKVIVHEVDAEKNEKEVELVSQ